MTIFFLARTAPSQIVSWILAKVSPSGNIFRHCRLTHLPRWSCSSTPSKNEYPESSSTATAVAGVPSATINSEKILQMECCHFSDVNNTCFPILIASTLLKCTCARRTESNNATRLLGTQICSAVSHCWVIGPPPLMTFYVELCCNQQRWKSM